MLLRQLTAVNNKNNNNNKDNDNDIDNNKPPKTSPSVPKTGGSAPAPAN